MTWLFENELKLVSTGHYQIPHHLDPFDFFEVMKDEYYRNIKFVDGAVSGALLEFHRRGRQCFQIGSALTEMFKATNSESVILDDLKLPYSCFAIQVPEGKLSYENNGEVFPIFELYVWRHRAGKCLSVICVADRMKSGGRYMMHHNLITIKEGATIGEVIRNSDSIFKGEQVNNLKHEIFNVVFNLVCYLNQDSAEIARTDNQASVFDKRMRKYRHLSPSKKNKLVTELLGKGACRSIKVATSLEESHKGTTCRHWVRGHWHTFLYGKGKKKRKLKWVMPYERNKDNESREGARVYSVNS